MRAGLASNPQFVGWGVEFADLDNDGWQDIFQANGHVYAKLDRQREVAETYVQRNLVYRNLNGERFEDVSGLAGEGLRQERSSRGAAFGDFDDDGDVDILLMNMGERVSLLRNDLPSGSRWLRLQLRGTRSNRAAVGSTVTITAGGRRQTRAVMSQSSYVSHNDLRPHFGLGSAESVDGVSVRWPSGETEEFPGVAVNRTWLLVEGSGSAEELP